ncbi:MAG: hypothetical protein O7G30_09360, partial [Proteobacteria bacterium]|nr:hypothetical protein [Pseudomonadota bacterium]
ALTGALVPLVPLNRDPDDGPLPVLGSLGCTTFEGGLGCLSAYLTDQQEALLGCGPFYGTSCDKHGVDLFNAEFSVIGQRFPNVEPEMAVGTRREFGNHFVLPGARGPDSLLYDPRLDGCVNAVDDGAAPAGYCAGAANDLLGAGFRSELAAVSENFVTLLAALGAAGTDDDGEPSDPDCSIAEPGKCTLVTAVAAISGVQRPEISALGNGRFGRRDFLWHSGGEAVLRYDKRNVLGFSMDMAEDRTGTNWGIEFTWIDDQVFSSNVTENNITEKDVFNLTISVDRITLIRFLNRNRSFFINSQWFFRWIRDYPGDREMTPNGPLTVLGTLAISTGYWQDRLIPSLVLVHDFMSASGGGFFQTSYRFSEVFSVTLGLAYFYGEPRRTRTGNFPLLNSSNRPPYLARTDYQGLSVISEREEIFMRIRYTF